MHIKNNLKFLRSLDGAEAKNGLVILHRKTKFSVPKDPKRLLRRVQFIRNQFYQAAQDGIPAAVQAMEEVNKLTEYITGVCAKALHQSETEMSKEAIVARNILDGKTADGKEVQPTFKQQVSLYQSEYSDLPTWKIEAVVRLGLPDNLTIELLDLLLLLDKGIEVNLEVLSPQLRSLLAQIRPPREVVIGGVQVPAGAALRLNRANPPARKSASNTPPSNGAAPSSS